MTTIPTLICVLDKSPWIGTRTGGIGNNGTGRDCPNYSSVDIAQNTVKSPGDLRRLVVTQTPVENHQLTLL